jgi:hypothetical protein
VDGPAGRPDHDRQHGYQHAPKVKPEAATAVELLMMGVRTPETYWAVNKHQDNKLEELLHLGWWFIWIELKHTYGSVIDFSDGVSA